MIVNINRWNQISELQKRLGFSEKNIEHMKVLLIFSLLFINILVLIVLVFYCMRNRSNNCFKKFVLCQHKRNFAEVAGVRRNLAEVKNNNVTVKSCAKKVNLASVDSCSANTSIYAKVIDGARKNDSSIRTTDELYFYGDKFSFNEVKFGISSARNSLDPTLASKISTRLNTGF